MKKATINQTIEIAKKLGGNTLKWSDKLTQEDASNLLNSIGKVKKNNSWGVWCFTFIVITSLLTFCFYAGSPNEVVKTQSDFIAPIQKYKTHIQAPIKVSVPIIKSVKTAPKKNVAYNQKQIEYASFKTLEILKKLFPASTVVIDKTLHSDNSIPLTVSGSIIIDGKKKQLVSNFSCGKTQAKVEIIVDGKKVYSL